MPLNIPPISWPKIYNMVNLGGIDFATVNGSQVPGIYQKITAALTSDHIEIFYNWKFADIVLPPSKVVIDVSVVNQYTINEEILIKSDDTVGIIGFIRIPVIIPLTAEENKVYDIPTGADGFGPVTVEVPIPEPTLVSLNVDENGVYTPEVGVDGFSDVTVEVPDPPAPILVSLNATQNGEYLPTTGQDGFSDVTVNVQPTLQSLNVNANGTYSPPTGVDGFSSVTVNTPTRELTLVYTLPSTYQEVEYINFPGNSWFEIPYNYTGEICIKGQDTSTDSETLQRSVAGYRVYTTNDYDWSAKLPRTNSGGSVNKFFWSRAYAKNNLTHIDDNGDGTLSAIYFTLGLRENPSKFYLGKYYSSVDTSGGSPFIGKIYKAYLEYCVGYSGNQAFVFYLVPCFRKSDNVVGMYDVVNSIFYTNQGTGTLTPGPNIN